jgi:hypothetical protein
LLGRPPGHGSHTLKLPPPLGQKLLHLQPAIAAHVLLHSTHTDCVGSGANQPGVRQLMHPAPACELPAGRYSPAAQASHAVAPLPPVVRPAPHGKHAPPRPYVSLPHGAQAPSSPATLPYPSGHWHPPLAFITAGARHTQTLRST